MSRSFYTMPSNSYRRITTLFFVFQNELFVNQLHGEHPTRRFSFHQVDPRETSYPNAFEEFEVF